jgi:2-polyprenyl-3-methyl-5-hydroxy-6-metoxy-1,4-benzoquinol methylase
MKCRHCRTPSTTRATSSSTSAPRRRRTRSCAPTTSPARAALPAQGDDLPECKLVQVDEVQRHDALFSSDYVYFSSFSSSWLAHAERYVEEACARLGLGRDSLVMEVASNDGYLLQYVAARGIPCVGIEPTAGTAEAARAKGIETIVEFFGEAFARRFVAERRQADLILGNNVLAHVPDIDDFVAGLREALAPAGTVTVEFPHLMKLVQEAQFDTIYHEHFSYLSLRTVQRIFAAQGLAVWDVEQLPTHGGSLRVWAQHAANPRPVGPRVAALLAEEDAAGMRGHAFYRGSRNAPTRSSRTCSPSSSSRSAPGAASRRTAPRPRAAPCSTTPACGRTCCRTWSTRRRTSRAASCRARGSRCSRPRRFIGTVPISC